jgi:hypothetical protein
MPLAITEFIIGRKLGRHSRLSSSEEEDKSEEDEDRGRFTPFRGAKPHQGSDSEDDAEEEEEEEDDFVVADDPNQTAALLPVMFSMDTHQDLSHHFKIICQLFVHLAVQPTEKRKPFMDAVQTTEGDVESLGLLKQSLIACFLEYQYFLVPLQIARRKLSGMRDSLVASSVWRSDFKKPLEKYPEISVTTLDFVVPQCDACHLGGRISTLCCRVHGAAYDKSTYEVSTVRWLLVDADICIPGHRDLASF